ncbi:hypothetical protein T265_15601, partial [Opisthorchis viverrini]
NATSVIDLDFNQQNCSLLTTKLSGIKRSQTGPAAPLRLRISIMERRCINKIHQSNWGKLYQQMSKCKASNKHQSALALQRNTNRASEKQDNNAMPQNTFRCTRENSRPNWNGCIEDTACHVAGLCAQVQKLTRPNTAFD